MSADDVDDPCASAPSACVLHKLDPDRIGEAADQRPPSATSVPGRHVARLLPGRPLPQYAYLPGRFPHPVRDPTGHSFKAGAPASASSDPDAIRWGADLFNHGYYWEAHEAWEERWRVSAKGGTDRNLLHGLILLAAAGVKLREGKWDAARRHGMRASSCLRLVADSPIGDLAAALGWPPSRLATMVVEAVLVPASSANGQVVFGFALGRTAELTQRGA